MPSRSSLLAVVLLLGACAPFGGDGDDVVTPEETPVAVEAPVTSAASVAEPGVDAGAAVVEHGDDAGTSSAGGGDAGAPAAPAQTKDCLLIICVGH